ncbi:hypothetical protein J2T58_002020 [Methanocalculus alkaliphilus]|uniref:DUF7288 family protein n=1 Tax=Methanocalculus alkaliphilus TaxID=768730 RepID=UPI0020A0805F|nr:hypothetical protein [Methanocalculus alkaliphilus]MCP1716145.1 hypothetical protein [Methanocalculus alkaliphilus]
MVVRDDATLYTIEGVAAALLMIATATIVFQAISIYTPGDTHIDDMLLEQLGADALAVMDMPIGRGGRTQLEILLNNGDDGGFHEDYYRLLRERSFALDDDYVQYSANILYRTGSTTGSVKFKESEKYTGYDPAVRVTRWVYLREGHNLHPPIQNRDQVVLLEVILWRG